MKFDSATQLENHLRKSAPDHLAGGYLLLIPCEVERKFYARKIYSFIHHYRPQLEWRVEGQEGLSLETMFEEELFGNDRFIYLDGFKEMDKQVVSEGLAQIPPSRVIVLGEGECSKEWLKVLEKRLVVLDLTEEKPWDKKKRYFEEVQKRARLSKINLQSEAWELLYENVGPSFPLLLQEIDKMICYVGKGGKEIDKGVVEAISWKQKEVNLWHVGESLVFGGEGSSWPFIKEFSDFLILLHAVRQNLYLGIRILESERKGETLDPKHLKFRKNKEGHYRSVCHKRGISYFTSGLQKAFAFELKGKTTSIRPDMLLDLFSISLHSKTFH